MALEASDRPTGSWPHHHHSLPLSSPAAYSPLPGTPFGGDPDRCPHRDEVTAHLLRYADQLDAEIRTVARLRDVRGAAGGSFTLLPKGRGELSVRGAVAA